MNDQRVYVFNQYYIDLLKKVKNYAKEQKDTSKPARDILRAMKKNYASMDKLDASYISVLDGAFWDAYEKLEDPTSAFPEEWVGFEVYTGIPLSWVLTTFTDKYTLHHYLTIFTIFKRENVNVDAVVEVLKHLLNKDFAEKVAELEDDWVKQTLIKLKVLHGKRSSSVLEDELKNLETTSLGKLAKEIMQDIDINEIQQTLQSGNMDILGSLQNPNSGFGKLISSVSSKMMAKMASGELAQETLLQDALGLASKLPGMIPGMGDIGKNMGGLSSMLSQFQKMGMNPESLMKGMMGGMGGMAGGAGGSSSQKRPSSGRMHSASRKANMSERLKKKIREKSAKENNNQSELVEDAWKNLVRRFN